MTRVDPYLQSNFLLEIEGLVVGGFQEVSGLELEIEYEEFRVATGHMFKRPKGFKHSNLVLKHGITDADVLWTWFEEVVEGLQSGKGAVGEARRRNGTIFLLDSNHQEAMWWNFSGAYPLKWSGPQLNAASGTVAVETIELVHKGITRPAASRQMSARRLQAAKKTGRNWSQ